MDFCALRHIHDRAPIPLPFDAPDKEAAEQLIDRVKVAP
jgi:hypothetical protein